MAKRVELYSLRITEELQHEIDKLSKEDKGRLNTQVIIAMERYIHMTKFKPGMYSAEDGEE